ncbi:MAG: 2-methylisocitrate lyase-like PEP mutase family enzyme [Paracoccaceae bacterium]|jgi:2-methylisocitrate lyase-like PEP mutase family enzyme
MRPTVAEKRQSFRALHEAGCFVIPNPWDVGSAAILQSLGFKALASSSAGLAWSRGNADYNVARDEVLAHLTAICAATDIPVNADFENGFADDPDGVAANVKLAIETGVAGLSVEDSSWVPDDPLYDFDLSVARVEAARKAVDDSGTNVFLTARSEGFFAGKPDFDDMLARIKAYDAAGADCLYAPGLREEDQIAAVVEAVAPKPVNVLTFGMSVETLNKLGVRRISVGGQLARSAYADLMRVGTKIAETGDFSGIQGGRLNLNKLYETYRED